MNGLLLTVVILVTLLISALLLIFIAKKHWHYISIISVVVVIMVLCLISYFREHSSASIATLAPERPHAQRASRPKGLSSKRPCIGCNKKNIYSRKLEVCESRGNPSEASQEPDYTCSEIGGGFHQICVEDMGKGKSFSRLTGQSGWSNELGDRNHCACLGAWANYVANTDNDKTLKCEAIPDTALDPKYVSNWKSWNQVTIRDQEKKGLDELYRQCYARAPDQKAAQYLKDKYDGLRELE